MLGVSENQGVVFSHASSPIPLKPYEVVHMKREGQSDVIPTPAAFPNHGETYSLDPGQKARAWEGQGSAVWGQNPCSFFLSQLHPMHETRFFIF